MQYEWQDDQPIYKQLKDKIIMLILKGHYVEDEALPSVRNVSAELNINHLTVSKAYQELVDIDLVEKRRGKGMFVKLGAQSKLLELEREKFYSSELPAFIQRVNQLGIEVNDILDQVQNTLEGH